MPMLDDIITVLLTSEIHEENICLPSGFTKAWCDELQISHLEDVEILLQEGKA
jgi:hypothetical protein